MIAQASSYTGEAQAYSSSIRHMVVLRSFNHTTFYERLICIRIANYRESLLASYKQGSKSYSVVEFETDRLMDILDIFLW